MCHTAEVHRVKGSVLREMGRESEALAALDQAVRISEDQGALGWQLRSSVALARMLSEGGDKPAAREVLERIYGRFPQDYETQDLLDARRLLWKLESAQI